MTALNKLTREEVIELLEGVGIACYEHETLGTLREALRVNIKDGTIPKSAVAHVEVPEIFKEYTDRVLPLPWELETPDENARLQDLPVDSNCGRACVAVVDAAAALVELLEDADAAPVRNAVLRQCEVYFYG